MHFSGETFRVLKEKEEKLYTANTAPVDWLRKPGINWPPNFNILGQTEADNF